MPDSFRFDNFQGPLLPGKAYRILGYGKVHVPAHKRTEALVDVLAIPNDSSQPVAWFQRGIGGLPGCQIGDEIVDGHRTAICAGSSWEQHQIEAHPEACNTWFVSLPPLGFGDITHRADTMTNSVLLEVITAAGSYFFNPLTFVMAMAGQSELLLRRLVFPVGPLTAQDLIDLTVLSDGRTALDAGALSFDAALRLVALMRSEHQTHFLAQAARSWRVSGPGAGLLRTGLPFPGPEQLTVMAMAMNPGEYPARYMVSRIVSCGWEPDLNDIVRVMRVRAQAEARKGGRGTVKRGPLAAAGDQPPINDRLLPLSSAARIELPRTPGTEFPNLRKRADSERIIRLPPRTGGAAVVPPENPPPDMLSFRDPDGPGGRPGVGRAELPEDPTPLGKGELGELQKILPLADLGEPVRGFVTAVEALAQAGFPVRIVRLAPSDKPGVACYPLDPDWGTYGRPNAETGRPRMVVCAQAGPINGASAYLFEVERQAEDRAPAVGLLRRTDGARLTPAQLLACLQHLARMRCWPTGTLAGESIEARHFAHRFSRRSGSPEAALMRQIPWKVRLLLRGRG